MRGKVTSVGEGLDWKKKMRVSEGWIGYSGIMNFWDWNISDMRNRRRGLHILDPSDIQRSGDIFIV